MSATELNLEDTQAVLEVLRKRGLAGGLEPVEFEKAMADYIGVKYAVAVSC